MRPLHSFYLTKFIVTIILFLAYRNPVFAEDKAYAPRDYSIVPASPEVSTLFNYQEFPVNYFNGIPEISFPLYTIKCGTIEIPITLSYHGGGIRYGQNTGNAGLCWDVLCGASIAHNVYGAPDDARSPRSDLLHGLNHLNDTEKSFRTKLVNKVHDLDSIIESNEWQAFEGERYKNGLTDLANDIYNLYGLGLSAVFAYDDEGKIIISSPSPISIDYTKDGVNNTDNGCDNKGYCITDTKGLTYYFKTQDRTRYDYHYGNPALAQSTDSIYYASAWHLDYVTDLSGNRVSYYYSGIPGRQVKDFSHSIARGFSSEELPHRELSDISSVSSVTYHSKILDRIEASGVNIIFNYRNRITGGIVTPMLSSIVIESPYGDTRTIEFKYRNNLLINVTDEGETAYCFEYNTELWPDMIFYRDDQDFGGYNNGKMNGRNIPNISFPQGVVGFGADRSVVPQEAQKGVLTKIIFPTGGYTELEWESNTFKYVGHHEYHGSLNTQTPVSIEQAAEIRMCMDDNFRNLEIREFQISNVNKYELDLTAYFLMNPANLYTTDYETSHDYGHYSETSPPHYPHVTIRRHSDNKLMAVYFLDRETIEEKGNNSPISLSLPNGTYDFKLLYPMDVIGAEDLLEREFMYGDCIAGRIYIMKSTYDHAAGSSYNYWCGLRIKRITSSTGDANDEPLRKDFFYNNDFNPDRSSGTVQLLPKFDYSYSMIYGILEKHKSLQSSWVYCVGETAFPNTTHGNFSDIQYPYVSTRLSKSDRMEPSDLNNIVEKYHYSSAQTSPYIDINNSQAAAFQPIGARMFTSKAHYRGNLLSKKIYQAGMPLTSLEYRYNIYEKTENPILTTDAILVRDFSQVIGWDSNPYSANEYGIGKYQIIPYNKTVATEHYSEENGIEYDKNYTYFYDKYSASMDYNLIKSVTTTSSENENITNYFTYLSGNGFYLPDPETSITVCSGKITSATRTVYDYKTRLPIKKYELSQPISPSILISSSQATTEQQKKYINTLAYEYKYGEKGNLLEIKYKGEVLVSYIWGYNGLYPIIEAQGIEYEQLKNCALSSGMNLEEINGNRIMSSRRITEIADNIRTQLSPSIVTSMSYHWFFGIVEMKDGRSIPSSYSYDNRGRLTEVRDLNNYLINKYTYHYAGTNL